MRGSGTTNDLLLLEENMELLQLHAGEILPFTPYYYSRIRHSSGKPKTGGVGMIPLGPWLEFWQQVPVNDAGKLVLTVGYMANPWSVPQEVLCRSGFIQKHPLPGITRSQLQDIFRRYAKQFDKADLPIAVPLGQVIEELRAGGPIEERLSQAVVDFKNRLYTGVAAYVGGDTFTHVPFGKPNTLMSWEPYHPLQKPVSFWVQQDHNSSCTLHLDLAVPAKYYEDRRAGILEGGGPVERMDLLNRVFVHLDGTLRDSGFVKNKHEVTLGAVGIRAHYVYPIACVTDLLHRVAIERLATLLQYLYRLIEREGLLPDR